VVNESEAGMIDHQSHIQRLFEAFPADHIQPATMVIYDAFLSQIPDEHFGDMIDWCILTCKSLPTIAEILATHRELCGEDAAQEADALKMAMFHTLFELEDRSV
jgi:hypothetical protein